MPTQTVMISMLGEIDNDFQRPVDNHGNRVTSSHLFRGEVPQQEMPDRVESSTQDMNPSDRSPPRSACSRNASALIPCDFLCNSKDDSEGHGNRKHGVLSDESVGAKEKLGIDSPAAASELPTPPASHLNNVMIERPCDARNNVSNDDDQYDTSPNSDGHIVAQLGKRKHTLSPESVKYLKMWILSPDHIDHPYPTDEEKQKIMADTGLGLNKVNNWFWKNLNKVNNWYQRNWKNSVHEVEEAEENIDCTRSASGAKAVSAQLNTKIDNKDTPVEKNSTILNNSNIHKRLKCDSSSSPRSSTPISQTDSADKTLRTSHILPQLPTSDQNEVSNEEKVEVEGIHCNDLPAVTFKTPDGSYFVRQETPFPVTLHAVVSDENLDDCIHWLPCGTKFMISDKNFFADTVLQTYFADRCLLKFASFTRRLKRWQFERVPHGQELGAYYHPHFLKDQPNLVDKIIYPDKHHTKAKKAPRTEIWAQSKKCIDGKLNQPKLTSTGSGKELINKLITNQGCGEDVKGIKKTHVDQGQFIPPPSFERNYTPPGIRREHIDKHMMNQGCGDGFKGIKKPYGDQGHFTSPSSFVSTSLSEGYLLFLASKANRQMIHEYLMPSAFPMRPPAPEFVPWQNASAGSGFATWKNAPVGACPKFILTSSGGAPISGDTAYFNERAGYSRIQEMHVDYPQPTHLLSAKHVFASSSRTDELTKAEIMIRKSISPDECTSSRHRKK